MISSVEKLIKILDLFTNEEPSLGNKEIAEKIEYESKFFSSSSENDVQGWDADPRKRSKVPAWMEVA
ncbi:hypothetical protein RCO48_33730 [Peribacillus frigoritolerans]|nr:hypothetical protein [Peribacillus frigoritolerans]